MFSAAGISTKRPVTATFTDNGTWTAPATTTKVDSASGYGGRGAAGFTATVYSYDRRTIRYFYGRDGVTTDSFQGFDPGEGRAPGPYCDPIINTPDDPAYFSYQDCYDFIEHSRDETTPPTEGDPTTAFGVAFPGAVGDVQPGTTTAANISVTPRQLYYIQVPPGGVLNITYYE